jgi:hypothetical protein
MSRKIPDDAFERYVAMGAGRSHKALADELAVTKRAVTKRAAVEKWTERLAKIEKDARERSDARMTETFEQMRERHMATLRVMNGKALTALKQYPLDNAMDAMRAAEMAIKLERLVAGQPADHTQVDVAEVTRQEMRRLLTTDPVGTNGPDDW